MARSELLKQMLSSYQHGDDAGFRRAAAEVIGDERKKQGMTCWPTSFSGS